MRRSNAILLGGWLLGAGAAGVAEAAPARSTPALAAARADYEAGRLDAAIARWEAALPGLPPAERPEVRARIANAHRKLGHLDTAEKLLAGVLEIAVIDREASLEALVRHYRGRLALDRGDTTAAEAELLAAERLYVAAPAAAELRAVRISLAGVQYLNAAIGRAYDTFTRLLEEARDADDVRTEALALEGLGDCLIIVGERALADGLLRQAETLYRELGDPLRAADTAANRVVADFWRGEVVDATRWATETLETPDAPAMRRVQATTIQATMDFLAGRKDQAPLAIDALARTLVTPDGGLAGTVAFIAAAELWLAADRPQAAAPWLERLANRKLTPLHAIAYRRLLGAWRLRRGDARGALGPLGEIHAIEARFLDEFRPELAESLSTQWLLGSSGVLYAEAVAATGTPAEALAAVGFAKARGTYLAIATARDALPAGDLLALVDQGKTRLGEARLRLGVAAPLGRAEDPTRFPVIHDGRVVALEYLITERRLETFLITADGVTRRPVGIAAATLEADARALEDAIAHGRPGWEVPAKRLSDALLGPWERELVAAGRRGARLLIVPHGALHRVPFAALPFDGALLADRLAEFYLPNLALAARLGGERAALPRHPTVAAFGEVRASQFGPLPGARAELDYLARRFKAVTHRDDRATASALTAAADEVDILHLAVHGRRGDLHRPSFLELDGGQTGPSALTAAEVATSRIPAGLVFLAACDSAGTTPNGSDEIPGALDRAFLLAGARTVVSARWALADRPARDFVETFYEELEGRGRLGALMAARQRIRTQGEAVSLLTRGLYPAQDERAPPGHPYFWAAFTLSGEQL